MSALSTSTNLSEFLRARRETTSPEKVGLLREAGRRVAGLRRPEVAELAGISLDYYVRLEQGRGRQPSERVLLSLGRALGLNEHERAYLLRIARFTSTLTSSLRVPSPLQHPGEDAYLGSLLDHWPHMPAFVVDRNLDVVDSNALARRIGAGTLDPGRNLVLRLFDPAIHRAHPAWEESAVQHLAALRFWSDPADPRLREILGDLGTRASDFPRLWARYDAFPLEHGTILTAAEGGGVVPLRYLGFSVPGREGLTLTTVLGDQG